MRFLFRDPPLFTTCLTILVLWYCNGSVVGGEKVKVVELNSGWRLRNQNGSIDLAVASIPSGVYSALGGLYGDVLSSYNDAALRWIALDNWTYTNSFNVTRSDYLYVRSVNLTLHGVDTVAVVRLNGAVVGETDNMFVRYSYDVKRLLRDENVLAIEIKSPIYAASELAEDLRQTGAAEPRPSCESDADRVVCHRNMLRKMQLSFGGPSSPAVPSMGIWKPVTLEYYDVALLRDLEVATRKNATHWTLNVRAHLSTGLQEPYNAELTLYAADLLANPINISRRVEEDFEQAVIEFQHGIPVNQVQLWWPNGYGVQKLYPLHFTINCWLDADGVRMRTKTLSHKSLKVGFRTVELLEESVDSGRTFLFKVNGVEVFMKGGVYLPAHILPELSEDQDRIHHILRSAKDAHMNMLRVWGGGLYESDYFYSLADYYGLLVWQDMAFTSATYPVTASFLASVRLETAQMVKRLAYHPSLALIVANDEVELALAKNLFNTQDNYENYWREYSELFAETIERELNVTSRSGFRPGPVPLRSTPSNGASAPNASIVVDNPQDPNYGDVHIEATGNSIWNPTSYPRARFVSAYGFPSLPITPSWNRSLGANDVLIDVMKHRKRIDSGYGSVEHLIETYLPLLDPDAEDYAEALIYFSQICQALAAKVATELFRSLRTTEAKTMGALYWHLNDVWVAPTSSSIDFYGNYKMLYYWSRDFLAPTAIFALYDSRLNAINVTLVRDEVNVDPEVYNVTMNMYLWSHLYPRKTISWQAILRQNDTQSKQLDLRAIYNQLLTRTNSLLEFTLNKGEQIVSRTFVYPGSIARASGVADPEISFAISWKFCNNDIAFAFKMVSYSLTIRVRRPALFVYIEVHHPDVRRYRLSHNGFIQVEPVKTVHLEIEQVTECIAVMREHIKVMAVNQFMVPTSGEVGDDGTFTTANVEDTTTVTEDGVDVGVGVGAADMNDPI